MYCSNCGSKLDEEMRFCGNCGSKVDSSLYEYHGPKLETFDKVLLGVCLFGMLFILFPQNLTFIVIGSLIAVATIILAVYRGIKKAHDIWAKVVILSTVNLLIQIGWYLFFDIIF